MKFIRGGPENAARGLPKISRNSIIAFGHVGFFVLTWKAENLEQIKEWEDARHPFFWWIKATHVKLKSGDWHPIDYDRFEGEWF